MRVVFDSALHAQQLTVCELKDRPIVFEGQQGADDSIQDQAVSFGFGGELLKDLGCLIDLADLAVAFGEGEIDVYLLFDALRGFLESSDCLFVPFQPLQTEPAVVLAKSSCPFVL